ncbi:methylamine utilization protein [Rhodanobacter ginsengiterrae]|uniref:methylamine utilization protein n=1 Tax=Rhodanobacter ginsengiterrae TaxID=2008451 RepID=UPI003CF9F260
MRCLFMVVALLLGSAWSASAAEVVVHLGDGRGHAVNDAVVMLTPDAATTGTPSAVPPATYIIDQRDETFIPYVQVLRPGDKVVFRNSDRTRHHVYSFAAIKTFEFVLRPGESSPALSMDQAGVAAVGCNIHDHMATYLFVSAVAAIAMSRDDGRATLGHLAPGHYTAHVWHPQLHPGRAEPSQRVTIAGNNDTVQLNFTLSLLPDPRMFMDREHLDY